MAPAALDPPPRSRRGHGRITLQDVAEAAGITKITVSRYLREPSRVAPDTAQRIMHALAATGYMPNKQAGMLASGRSGMVAAIVPSLANSVFAETVQALSEGLQPAGFELMLASSGYSMLREEAQIRAVLGWSPDALAVTGHHHTPAATAMLRVAARAGTPIIELWDCEPQPGEFIQIGFDHAVVGRAMAQHLVDAGYRCLAYVDTGVAADFRAHERGKAFAAEAQNALARCGWPKPAAVRLITAPAGDASRPAAPRCTSCWPARAGPGWMRWPLPTTTWPVARCSKPRSWGCRCRGSWPCSASVTLRWAASWPTV